MRSKIRPGKQPFNSTALLLCGLLLLSACTTGRYVSSYHQKGMVFLSQHQPEKAAAEFQKGLLEAQKKGTPAAIAELTAILGWTKAETMDFSEAADLLTRAIGLAESQAIDPAVMYGRLAVVHAKSGNIEPGLSAAQKAIELTAARWRQKSKKDSVDDIIDYAVRNPGMPPDEDMIRAAIMAEAARAILYFSANNMPKAIVWGERTVDHCNALAFIMKMAPTEDRIIFHQGKGVAAGVASRSNAALGNRDRAAQMLQAGKEAFKQIGIPVQGDDLLAAYIASGGYDKQARKEDSRDVRFSIQYNQAVALWNSGKAAAARQAFAVVAVQAEENGQTTELARALSQQGWISAETGRYAEAVRLLEKSISVSPLADEAAMSHTRLAAILARLGNFEKALQEAQKALDVAVKNRPAIFSRTDRETAIERFVKNPGLPPDVVMLKAVLGSEAARTICWYFMGEYKKTARTGEKSIRHFQAAENALSLAAARERRDFFDGAGYAAMATGDALTFTGEPEKGRKYLKLAETYFDKSGSVFGLYATKALYACSYLREKRYAEGAATMRSMWAKLDSAGFEDILWRAKSRFAYYFDLHSRTIINDLGLSGKTTLPPGKLAPENSRAINTVVAGIREQLDSVYLLLEDEDAAKTRHLVTNLENAVTGLALRKAANALVHRIKVIAYKNYVGAIDRVESIRATLETDLNKRSFRSDKQMLYDGYIRLAVELYGAQAGLEALERAKARDLLDLMATREVNFNTPLARSEKTLRQAVSRQIAQNQTGIQTDPTEHLPDEGVERYRAIVVKIKKEAPELASLISANSLPFEQITRLIPRRTALCAYHISQDYGFIFTVVDGRANVKKIRVTRKDLTEKISRFRESILKKDAPATRVLSGELYSLLVRPVEKQLGSGRIIFVPDNALFYLPFSVLHNGRAYLIERYSLAYTPSMGILKFAMAKARSKDGRVLALGNPDLNNPDLALPSAQAEAQKVADRFPGSKVYVGKLATETVVRTTASQFDIIHFATHGEFSVTDPLYSSLRLAADNRNDGRLEAAEIFSLRMSPWLVTLSACRTGLGVVTAGGEIIGLNRAFIYAGAPAVVSSLWSIGDDSTAVLMGKFYNNLKSMPRDAALRAAQVDMIYGGQFAEPFYWAAFYLTGDFR